MSLYFCFLVIVSLAPTSESLPGIPAQRESSSEAASKEMSSSMGEVAKEGEVSPEPSEPRILLWHCPCQDECLLEPVKRPLGIQRIDKELRRLHSKLKKIMKITLSEINGKHRMNQIFRKYRNMRNNSFQIKESEYPSLKISNLHQTPTRVWLPRLHLDLQYYTFLFSSFNQEKQFGRLKQKKITFVLQNLLQMLCLVEQTIIEMGLYPPPRIPNGKLILDEVFLWATLQQYIKFNRQWRIALASPTKWMDG